LQKHLNRDHRDSHAPRHQAPTVTYNQLSKFPDDLDPEDVQVTAVYCLKVPPGFHEKDLPLMKVRVRLPGEAQERIYMRYSDVKERFPKQLLDFFEQQVVVLRHNEDSNLDSEEEAARRREWMRSISRQQQSHQMYSRPPHQQQQRQSTLQVQSRVVEESVVGSKRLHHQRD